MLSNPPAPLMLGGLRIIMNPPDYFEEGDIQPNGAGVFGERRDIQVTRTVDFVRLISNQLMPVTLGE